MAYLWHNDVIDTHAIRLYVDTWPTYGLHMSFKCPTYVIDTHAIRLYVDTRPTHVIHMPFTCHSHALHMAYTWHTVYAANSKSY